MPSTELAFERLRYALASLEVPVSPTSRADLERRVCDYVDTLKASDWPPERIIAAVKRMANQVGFHASRPVWDAEINTWTREDLLTQIVSWCIEHYYRSER